MYRYDNACNTPVSTAANTVTGGTGVKTPISFDIQSVVTDGDSAYQSQFNTVKKALKSIGTKEGNNYPTYTPAAIVDTNNYDGLVSTTGVVLYDMNAY